MILSDQEEIEYLKLLEQDEREKLSPKLEQARTTDKPIVIVQGGRGAGAKSWGIASLLIQLLNYEHHRLVCLREVQRSLEESVWQLMVDTISRLQYPNWNIRDDYLENRKTKSHVIFRGLKDLRASQQAKGLERYDLAWLEEAATISEDSITMLMPTIVRNPWWRLFITYNPETEKDPVTVRFWDCVREDVLRIRVEPGRKDNPWWSDGLQSEMEISYALFPDEARHIWGGYPRSRTEVHVFHNIAIWDFNIGWMTFANHRQGMDFGFNHANAFMQCGYRDGELYLFGESWCKNQLNKDFIKALDDMRVMKEISTVADSADPDKIEEWNLAGYNVRGALKGAGSLLAGVNYLKGLPKIHIHKTLCPNAAREFSNYKYRQAKDGTILEEVVEIDDDTIAAVRYATEDLHTGNVDSGLMSRSNW